jgi:SAM-dependent methyltransferase
MAGGAEERPVSTFDKIAHVYDESLPRHVVQHYLEKRADWIGSLFRPGDRLLDVGCGTGTLARFLRGRGFGVLGIDASHPMLAAQRAEPFPAAQASGDRLPFADGAFAGSYCVAVLHHLIEPAVVAGTIREMVRVTRPGGAVVLWDHNPLNPYWPLLMHRVPQDDGSERLVPLREITAELGRHPGLEVVSRRSGFIPDFLPPRLLPLGRRVESLLEATPLIRSVAAHNVVVARKAATCG